MAAAIHLIPLLVLGCLLLQTLPVMGLKDLRQVPACPVSEDYETATPKLLLCREHDRPHGGSGSKIWCKVVSMCY